MVSDDDAARLAEAIDRLTARVEKVGRDVAEALAMERRRRRWSIGMVVALVVVTVGLLAGGLWVNHNNQQQAAERVQQQQAAEARQSCELANDARRAIRDTVNRIGALLATDDLSPENRARLDEIIGELNRGLPIRPCR